MTQAESKDEQVFFLSVVLTYTGFSMMLVMHLPKVPAWERISPEVTRLFAMSVGLWWTYNVRPFSAWALSKYKQL